MARHRRWILPGVAVAVGLMLVFVLTWAFVLHPDSPTPSPDGTCPPGLATDMLECVGPVSDSAGLHPELRPVADKIFNANRQVVASGKQYVRVALLTPLGESPKPGTTSAMSVDQIRFSLEGAYTALLRATTTYDFRDPHAPDIELLLVDQGSRQVYTDALRDRILALGTPEHPLVAVAGLGSSFPGTEAMAAALAEHGIPTIGAVTSSTSLSAARQSTFHSVSPDNLDYVKALRHLLDTQREALPLRRALLVADQNEDPYTLTLSEAFQAEMKDYLFVRAPLVYHGSTVETPVTANVFASIRDNICNAVAFSKLDTIFFAGRVADFPVFAESLSGRVCPEKPLTVMVGATGFHAAAAQADVLDAGNVTVIYASSADAPSWAGGGPDTPKHFGAFLDAFRSSGFDDASLVDGYAVMYHDAVAATAHVIRMATNGIAVPSAADVNAQFTNVTLASTVPAASGTLAFGPRAAVDGRVSGKVIVFRQIGKSSPRLPAGVPPYLTP